jgi:glycosyltransferase involved in cell wall biosynthesis
MRRRRDRSPSTWDATSTERALNDGIAKKFFDELTASPNDMAIHHTVQITSFGGSGTTALCNFLADSGVDVPRTPGHFPFKHQPVPPPAGEVPPGFRAIYLCGDPRDAVASLFRRGFQGGHYRGMRLAAPPPEVEARLASLQEFVDAGIDDYEIEAHFDRWHAASGYPVLFVKYDALGTSWPTIREFVGLPDDAPGLPITSRNTDWRTLPKPIRRGLDRMYGGLARRIDALPATYLVDTTSQSSTPSRPDETRQPLTITFLAPSAKRPIGGVIALYEFANGLARRGHHVHLVHLPVIEGHIDSLDDLDWFDFEARVHHQLLSEFDPDALPRADFIELTALRFFTDSGFVGAVEAESSKPWGRPFIFVQAYGIYPEAIDDRAFATPAPKLCVARWLTDVARSKGVPDEDLAYIPCGINHAKYRVVTPIDARPRQVSMLYGIHPLKGAPDGLEALAEVQRRSPDVRVVVFCNREPIHEIPAGIDFRVAPPQDVIVNEIYNDSRVFICSSLKEGFGLGAVEAMSCGCSLVTTDNGGSDDYAIPGQTALVTEPRDIKGMVDCIEELLDDDARRIALATAGVEMAQRFDWDNSSRLLEDFLVTYRSRRS